MHIGCDVLSAYIHVMCGGHLSPAAYLRCTVAASSGLGSREAGSLTRSTPMKKPKPLHTWNSWLQLSDRRDSAPPHRHSHARTTTKVHGRRASPSTGNTNNIKYIYTQARYTNTWPAFTYYTHILHSIMHSRSI